MYKFIYLIKSLKGDILPAIKSLVRDIGNYPGTLVTDFDHKLMGSKVSEYLADTNCHLEAAPPKHQHQNILVERNWCAAI